MSKQIVITIPGVNPNKEWQNRTARVLSPHFDCKNLACPAYDNILGPVRAVVNIPLLTIALVIVCGFVFELLEINFTLATLLFGGFVTFLILSGYVGWWRRMRQINLIKKELDKVTAYGRPHIVAHSLGTYLIGNALNKFPNIRLGHVLLVSSVLPKTYPWANLLRERPGCVLKVRNEYGTSDSITKLVGRLRWVIRDLGSSGVAGFDGDGTVIHNSISPLADCPLCRETPVPLHNVPLEKYAHSSMFLGEGHARMLWLPFLWGLVPEEFFNYLEQCQKATREQDAGLWYEADATVARLWSSTFSWTDGRPLVDYVKEVTKARLKRPPAVGGTLEQLVGTTMTVLHVVTDQACAETNKPDPRDENVECGLHPRIAIARATDYVINEWRSNQVHA